VTGSFRTSSWALARFEVRAQLREPLTVLYALVFLLLSFGYITTTAVELVSDRGTVSRTSPWALALAFGGLTAFGQVITTMVATTALLRDEAERTRPLVATTGVGPHTWFLARVAAALTIMLLVYAAMPLGVLAGTVVRGDALPPVLTAAAHAYAVITIPTMVVVTLLLASAAAVTQRVLGVLATALVLVGVWQAALALVAHHDTRTLGALLDPFGNAPVLAMTHDWTEPMRETMPVRLSGVLLANRVLWCAVAAMVAGLVLRFRGHRFFEPRAERVSAQPSTAGARLLRRLRAASSAFGSVRAFTVLWIRTDGGWRVVGALAVLNALANGLLRPVGEQGEVPAAVTAMLVVSEHARIFLILLATVYAGELVWRERDVRIAPLIDATPVGRAALVWGRLAGLLQAQGAVVVPLAAGGLLTALVAHGRMDAGSALPITELLVAWGAWSVFVLWLPFAQLTLLSLAVHVWLDHKVAAHLLLITGWVVAVGFESRVPQWWLRFSDAAPLWSDRAVNWLPLWQRGACWTAAGAALAWYCAGRWPVRVAAATSRR
jgi:ABC-2 type transport system permease protein